MPLELRNFTFNLSTKVNAETRSGGEQKFDEAQWRCWQTSRICGPVGVEWLQKIDCGTVTACPSCRCQDGLPESTLQAACNALQSASLLVIVNDDEVVVVVVAVAVE